MHHSLVTIRVIGDVGCERIQKDKKVQRVKVLFLLSQGWEGTRCGDGNQHGH